MKTQINQATWNVRKEHGNKYDIKVNSGIQMKVL